MIGQHPQPASPQHSSSIRLYDAAIVLTREAGRRAAVVAQLAPRYGERIADVGRDASPLATLIKAAALGMILSASRRRHPTNPGICMTNRNPAPARSNASRGQQRSSRLAATGLAVVVAGVDQVTKAWAKTLGTSVEVAPFLNLDLGFNRGVTFGLLSANSETGRWLLVAITGIVAATVLVAAWRTCRLPLSLALGAVAGGAIGNIIDRVRQGEVTDFIDFHIADWRWPMFNLADAAIVCGVAVLLWLSVKPGKSNG